MKPEQVNQEFTELVRVPLEDRLSYSEMSEELRNARNKLGARVEALFNRIDALDTEALDDLFTSGKYNGPEVHLFGPELKTEEVGLDGTFFSRTDDDHIEVPRHTTFVRGAEFYLPIPETTARVMVGSDADLEELDLTRIVKVGFQRTDHYEACSGQEKFIDSVDSDYEVEAITTLSADECTDDDTIDEAIETFVVLESTGTLDIFKRNGTDIDNIEGIEDPDDYKYPGDVDIEQAQAIAERKLETVSGYEILESFDIGALEAAVAEIELQLAA